MAEIRNENHIVIHGWMRNELNLKGNELLVYALLYGFSQDGESSFKGKLAFIQDWFDISKKTAITIIQKLEAKGLVSKSRSPYGKFEYGVKITPAQGEEITPTGCKNYTAEVKKLHLDGEEITPPSNNTSYNSSDNYRDKKERDYCVIPKEKATRFSPPTIEDIKKYCQERNNQVDAERFYDFYESKGWMVGKNKMKDWKAAVRTWEREDKKSAERNIQKSEDPFAELKQKFRDETESEINSKWRTDEI